MIEVEVLGGPFVPGAPSPVEMRSLCVLVTAAMRVEDGHLAIEFVSPERIAALNSKHRGKPSPTDVLSFPVDGVEPGNSVQPGNGVPRELGDIVICPEHTANVREAIVHGALHLLGMDHETDGGEMLALQAELLARDT
jgi:probable rRNA maturation factor